MLSQQEVAELLGVSVRTVIRMVDAKELESVRIGATGRGVRIPLASVERWIKGQLKKGA